MRVHKLVKKITSERKACNLNHANIIIQYFYIISVFLCSRRAWTLSQYFKQLQSNKATNIQANYEQKV